MIISSQSDQIMKTPEGARKYAPVFAEAGFKAIDFGFCDIFTQSNVRNKDKFELMELPYEERTAYFREIAKIFNDNGLVVGQTHAHFSTLLADGEEEHNAYLLEMLKREIECTAAMGCKYIVIHPICMGYDAAYTWKMEKADNMKMYTALIDTLKKYDVVCCLENMWGVCNGKIVASACGNMIEAAEYIDTLNEIAGEERFGFCFDSGHAMICSVDPIRSVHLLGNRIKLLHLHDVEVNRDAHTCPYLGITDWDGLMKALAEINYSGTLNFEAANAWKRYPAEVYPEAIKLLGAICKGFADKYF